MHRLLWAVDGKHFILDSRAHQRILYQNRWACVLHTPLLCFCDIYLYIDTIAIHNFPQHNHAVTLSLRTQRENVFFTCTLVWTRVMEKGQRVVGSISKKGLVVKLMGKVLEKAPLKCKVDIWKFSQLQQGPEADVCLKLLFAGPGGASSHH